LSIINPSFTVVGGLLLFAADDGAHGIEMWGTDGVNATRLVQDVAAGAGSSFPTWFTAVGPLVFFAANDNISGRELWAISRSALHQAFNLPAPSADAADDSQSSAARGSRQEPSAFSPFLVDDPREPASEANAP